MNETTSPSKTPPKQPHLDLERPFDIAYWTAIFGCSAAELRRAVAEVGPGVDDVRRHFLH